MTASTGGVTLAIAGADSENPSGENPAGASTESAASWRDRAREALERGDPMRAVELFGRALDASPSAELRSEILRERALLRLDNGDAEGAQSDLDAAIAAQPSNVAALSARAALHAANGENDQALADLTQAIRHAPDDPALYLRRGSTWLEKSEPRRAISDFRRAIDLKPFDRRARYLLAKGYAAVHRPREVVDQLDLALADASARDETSADGQGAPPRADPRVWLPLGADTADAYYLRSLARLELGDAAAALSDMRRALEIAPRSELFRAEFLRQKGRLGAP